MGDGIQRDKVQFLSYLFYVGDRKKTDLPLIRVKKILTVNGTDCVTRKLSHTGNDSRSGKSYKGEKYGFIDFKLKSGVLSAKDELAVQAIKRISPMRELIWIQMEHGRWQRLWR